MSEKSVLENEQRYWHVTKFGLLPLVGLLVFSVLAYFNFGLLDWSWLDVEAAKDYVFFNLIVVCPFLFEYLFISLAVISFAAFLKGGYRKLKSFEEEGLIASLILGVIWGLVMGLVWGLIAGLVLGLIAGLIAGLVLGLFAGLIWGLIAGLVLGLIWGLVLGVVLGLIAGFFYPKYKKEAGKK